MCLIINSETGFEKVSRQLTKDIYQSNSDGFGFMYYDSAIGDLVVHKDVYTSYKPIHSLLQDLPKDRPVSVHFRYATSGNIDQDTAHPFPVIDKDGYRVWLMHNGVMGTYEPKKGDEMSDTMRFIANYLTPRLFVMPKLWLHPAFQDEVERVIGGTNKLVMFDSEGNTATFNEDAGVKWENYWMSNTYAWPSTRYLSQPKYNWGGKGTGTDQYGYYDSNGVYHTWYDYENDDDDWGTPTTKAELVDVTSDGTPLMCEEDYLDEGMMTLREVEDFVYANPKRAAAWIFSNMGEY